jgi:actin-related protein
MTIAQEKFMLVSLSIRLLTSLRRAPEALFNPAYASSPESGFQDLLTMAFEKTGFEGQRSALQKVYLAGGNTCFPGLAGRLENELLRTFPGVTVEAPTFRGQSAWIGGSMWSSGDLFEKEWISKEGTSLTKEIILEILSPTL